MKIRTLFYILRQGFRGIFRNKLFTLASMATIAACLFLFGLFYSVLTNFQHIVKTAQEGVSVTVFFEEGTEDARMKQIGDLILARTEEVDHIEFISADQAWKDFSEQMNFGELAENLPENPLANHANYEIYVKDVSKQASLVTYLESIPDVRKVVRSELAATTLSGVNLMIAYVSGGIILILLAVSVFLISNTVTIGISVRQEEINIMKYVGATDFFVRAPFVIEGMIIGLVGAAIPLGAIYYLYDLVISYALSEFPMLTNFLNFLPVGTVFKVLVPISLIIGVGIGFFGSYVTTRKHLHV
ncbi:MAG: permease-like cell division protein FtsX [Lachnospiraceae bacterium]|nr:permease-like cell division protein FtsX [Lachnospiraceae bacterium]